MAKLSNMSIEEVAALYQISNEIMNEYARMTDTYGLATGDKLLENIGDDLKGAIAKRQRYFTYKQVLRAELEKRMEELMP